MKILLGSSPGLRQKSREVTEDEFGKELDQHMDSMLEKMLLSNGVGLSGPQVGDHRCIIVADSGSVELLSPIYSSCSVESTFTLIFKSLNSIIIG